jgi:hypothetical protein
MPQAFFIVPTDSQAGFISILTDTALFSVMRYIYGGQDARTTRV